MDNWEPSLPAAPLEWGRWFHRGLEIYESTEGQWRDRIEETLIRLADEVGDWDTEDPYRNRDRLFKVLVQYTYHYRADPWETVQLADGKPATELSFTIPIDDEVLLCGHLDKVVRYRGQALVVDYKTTKSWHQNPYNPHNQMTLYTLAGKVAVSDAVSGVLVDVVSLRKEDARFTRVLTMRPPQVLEEWLQDLRWWLRLARIYAEDGHWPMNDTACDKYGGCPFRDVCSSPPFLRERMLETKFKKREKPWNPLEPR